MSVALFALCVVPEVGVGAVDATVDASAGPSAASKTRFWQKGSDFRKNLPSLRRSNPSATAVQTETQNQIPNPALDSKDQKEIEAVRTLLERTGKNIATFGGLTKANCEDSKNYLISAQKGIAGPKCKARACSNICTGNITGANYVTKGTVWAEICLDCARGVVLGSGNDRLQKKLKPVIDSMTDPEFNDMRDRRAMLEGIRPTSITRDNFVETTTEAARTAIVIQSAKKLAGTAKAGDYAKANATAKFEKALIVLRTAIVKFVESFGGLRQDAVGLEEALKSAQDAKQEAEAFGEIDKSVFDKTKATLDGVNEKITVFSKGKSFDTIDSAIENTEALLETDHRFLSRALAILKGEAPEAVVETVSTAPTALEGSSKAEKELEELKRDLLAISNNYKQSNSPFRKLLIRKGYI
jgi:hypothetical protein